MCRREASHRSGPTRRRSCTALRLHSAVHSVSFAHSAAAGKALTQVQYTSPGVQHRARVFFCKASGMASFVLPRVVHHFPWKIAAQHGCWRNSRHRAGLYIFCCLSLGGFPLCERNNICSAICEVYEAATLPAETPGQKQEIQGGTPAIFFLVLE